jgi:hypothetical protein
MYQDLAQSGGNARRALVVLAVLAVCALTTLTAPQLASAGTYNLVACTAAGGANNSWSSQTNHGGMTAYNNCGDLSGNGGLVARHALQPAGWTVPWLSYAGLFFDAPAGTSIIGADLSYQMTKAGGPDYFNVGLYCGDGTPLHPSTVCQGAPGCSSGDIRYASHFNLSPTSQIKALVQCATASCPTSGADYGSIHIGYASVTLDNYSAPSLTNGRGNLWMSSSWLNGVQSGAYDAADDVGIKNAIIDVDGSSSNGLGTNVGYSCNYTLKVPCPNGGAGVSFNTANLSDGAHTIRFLALDTADNWGDAGTHTFYVDNNAPGATGTPSLGGGRSSSTWYSTNGFNLSFSTPGTAGAPTPAFVPSH